MVNPRNSKAAASRSNKDSDKQPATPPSNKGNAKAPPPSPSASKLSPKSMFGKSINVGKVMWELLRMNILVVYVVNAKTPFGAFLSRKMTTKLKEDEKEKAKLGFDALLYRKGENQNARLQKPGAEYKWEQYVFLMGDEAAEEKRLEVAKRCLAYFRKFCNLDQTPASRTPPLSAVPGKPIS